MITLTRSLLALLIMTLTKFGITSASFPYNESLALRTLHLSGAAYCSIPQLLSWTLGIHQIPNFTLTSIFNESSLQAFTGYDSESDAIVVAIRGSEEIGNWINDFEGILVYPYDAKDIGIHDGLHKEYTIFKQWMIDSVNDVHELYQTEDLIVTGHSSGAANAVLFGYDVLRNQHSLETDTNLNENIKLKLINSYGSPRVGNDHFAKSFHSYGINHNRIVHSHDIVPHLPPLAPIYHYTHTSREIHYNSDSSKYRICDEDDGEDGKCSDKYKLFNAKDHEVYLGFRVGVDGCKISELQNVIENTVEESEKMVDESVETF